MIIPSESILSSLWIFICGLLVLWYENKVRNSREELIGKFLARIENNLGSRLMTQLTSHDVDSSVKFEPDELDKITNYLQRFIDYLRTSFIYAILDSPFIVIYLIAIAIIGGNIVWAPIIIMGVSGLITLVLSQYYDSASSTESRKNIDTFREQYNLIKIDKQVRFLGLVGLYTKRLRNIYGSQAIANIKASKYMSYLQIYLSLSSRLANCNLDFIGKNSQRKRRYFFLYTFIYIDYDGELSYNKINKKKKKYWLIKLQPNYLLKIAIT